jgi:hypothetical protein
MQLSQVAGVTSKLEVQDPEVHRQGIPSILPLKVQRPIVTSIMRCCQVVEGGVNDFFRE